MDKLITNIEDLPEQQQSRIKERLQELNQKAMLLLDQMPDEFDNYIEKALKECNETMRDMIGKSTDEYNDKGALSFIYVLHKERKNDLERLREKTLNGQRQHQSLNPEPQRKGRPKKTIKDLMIDDADGSRLQMIHNLMQGQKGKGAALIILACMKKGWMQKPTFTQVESEFGNIGSQQGFTKYLCENLYSKEEIEGAINMLS